MDIYPSQKLSSLDDPKGLSKSNHISNYIFELLYTVTIYAYMYNTLHRSQNHPKKIAIT